MTSSILVEKAVPSDVGDPALVKRLLAPQVGPQFADGFFDRAQNTALPAVQSKLRLAKRKCTRDEGGMLTCRFSNFRKTEMLKFEQRRGKAAYLNTTREWSPKMGNNEISDEQALALARDVVKAWGIPDGELDMQFAELRHLNLAGGPKLDARPAEFLSTEVHVRFPRHISGVPVFDSDVRLAVDARGEVARMRVMWPSFGLVPGLDAIPLPRDEVVRMTAEELSEGAICQSLSKVDAFIAYVSSKEVESLDPADDGSQSEAGAAQEAGQFVPALVVYAYPVDPPEDSGQLAMAGRQIVMPLLDAREDGQ